MPRIDISDAEPYISIGINVITNGNSRATMGHSIVRGKVVSIDVGDTDGLHGFHIQGFRDSFDDCYVPGRRPEHTEAISSWQVSIKNRQEVGWIELDMPVSGSIIEYKE
jgi:hypothetical protein